MNYVASGQKRRFYAKDVNDLARIANDIRFPLRRGRPDTTRQLSVDSDIFAVDLTQTGGSAGSYSETCSFTYTAYRREDTTTSLGTELSPVMERLPNCPLTAATVGIGRYKNDGSFELLYAAESPTTETAEVHQVRYKSSGTALQYRAANVRVLAVGSWGGWTDLTTLEESDKVPCIEPGS